MYLDYYQLSQKPFQLTPNPAFYFGSQGHDRALAYLRYGLATGEGFVVISGDVGTGKSTLLKILLNELSARADLCVVEISHAQLGSSDLFRLAAIELGLVELPNDISAVINCLEKHLVALHKQNKRVIFAIDEAQDLPDASLEALRLLSNLSDEAQPLVQILLLGQSELRHLIDLPEWEHLRQRISATCHLKPLNIEETRDYIKTRLDKAGWQKDWPFTGDALEAIHRLTNGVPRQINTLCDRVLLYGFLESAQSFNVNAVENVVEEIGWSISETKPAGTTNHSVHSNSNKMPQDLQALQDQVEALRKDFEQERSFMREVFQLQEKYQKLKEH